RLRAMPRKGRRLPLRSALHEATGSRRTAVRDNVELETDDKTEFVRITIEPLREDDNESLYLVVFTDLRVLAPEQRAAKPRKGKAHDGNVEHLERELRETRERLQSMAEEYETAIEELKSSNEEMVSVNEELQSANEELQTVNHELTLKIDEVDRANSDLKNLYESTDIATVFLDRELIIRSFTPAVTRIFNLIPTDRGRPLTDIAHELD